MNVALCRDDGTYLGGETLSVRWQISRVPLEQVQSVEVSVLWHTEGKGDEDLTVHHFSRLDENQIRRVGLADEQSTSCRLPATPLSYHGRLISVRWCVRMRLFVDGREIVAEQPFHMVANRNSIAGGIEREAGDANTKEKMQSNSQDDSQDSQDAELQTQASDSVDKVSKIN